MADIQRELFISDIKRIKEALNKTNSEYLKRDYTKALKRKYRELRQYDKYHKSGVEYADRC